MDWRKELMMSSNPAKRFTPRFKFQIVLESLKGEKAIGHIPVISTINLTLSPFIGQQRGLIKVDPKPAFHDRFSLSYAHKPFFLHSPKKRPRQRPQEHRFTS